MGAIYPMIIFTVRVVLSVISSVPFLKIEWIIFGRKWECSSELNWCILDVIYAKSTDKDRFVNL